MEKDIYKLPPSVQTLRSVQFEKNNYLLSVAIDFLINDIMKDAYDKIIAADLLAMKDHDSSKINRVCLFSSESKYTKKNFLYVCVEIYSQVCTLSMDDKNTNPYPAEAFAPRYKYYPLSYVINGNPTENGGQTSVIYRLNAELSKLGYRVMTGEGSDCERCAVYVEWDNPSYVAKVN